MARVKRGVPARKRHKRLLKQTKGFFGKRKNCFRKANETLLRAMAFSYVGRKHKKRNFRKIYIMRTNAACRQNDISYSKFINGLQKANIILNRKMLGQLAALDSNVFKEVCSLAKAAL